MSKITITQGTVKATLSNVTYSRASGGFDEFNTAYVLEESLAAGSDVELEEGKAKLTYKGRDWPVEITVMNYVEELIDSDDDERGKLACEIEINHFETGGLPQLAYTLGLLDHYSKKELAGLGVDIRG